MEMITTEGMDKDYYVYRHLNPTTKDVFYIGVGKGHRVVEGGRHRNRKWQRYVYENGGFLFDFVAKNLTKRDALDIERKLINQYGLDNLTNMVGESGNSTAFVKGQTPWNKGLKGAQACRTKSVTYRGQLFGSVKDLKAYLGISNTTYHRRLKKGTLHVEYET